MILLQKYSLELQNNFLDTFYDDKYKFYHDGYSSEYTPSTDNWGQHEFVSIDSYGDVIGYIAYSIDRNSYSIDRLRIINFSDNRIIFGKDVITVLNNAFTKYNFRKLTFCVFIGNPIEKSYDKLINKYGGRIVGYYKKHERLSDGELYDMKMYEIFREDYIKSLNNKNS